MFLRLDLVFVQRVAFLDEIKCFVWLNHQLLVGFSQVFGLNDDYFLLLELDVAASCDDDSVLAWIMLFRTFPSFCDFLL